MKKVKIKLGYDVVIEFEDSYKLIEFIKENTEDEIKSSLRDIFQAKNVIVKAYKDASFKKVANPIYKDDKMFCPECKLKNLNNILLSKVSQKSNKKYFYCSKYECEYYIFEKQALAGKGTSFVDEIKW